LATFRTVVDVGSGELVLSVGDEKVTLQAGYFARVPSEQNDTRYSVNADKNPRTLKEITKQRHSVYVKRKNQFKVGDKVLLDKSDPQMFPSKLKLRWLNPFVVQKVFPYGTIEVTHPDYGTFRVNSLRLKLYFCGSTDNKR
ncbi:hypothetical protein Gogos_021901, partial [Gossypium gossypioides]|nr:hypothetical protein [Gossypium gossypioides]